MNASQEVVSSTVILGKVITMNKYLKVLKWYNKYITNVFSGEIQSCGVMMIYHSADRGWSESITSSLELTQYYCVNCHCITVTVLIKLNSCVSWSASETVASVHLPLNSGLAEVLGHTVLWRQCSCSTAQVQPTVTPLVTQIQWQI